MKKFAIVSLALLAIGLVAAPLMAAEIDEPVLGVQDVADISIGVHHGPNSAQVNSIAYDATNQAVSAGSSSTDLSAIYGDEMVLAAGFGEIISAMKFAIFCSSSSAANLTSATETIRFYDLANAGAFIGGFSTSIGAIAKGYYSIYTLTNIDPLAIIVPSADILATQQLSGVIGATRMGTVLSYANAPAVGSTNAGYYASNASLAAGWYLTTGQTYSNLQYELETAQAVVPAESQSWGSLKAEYR